MRRALALVSLGLALMSPIAAQARVVIRVDLGAQTMRVETPGGDSYRWAISSGKKGFRTPTGAYSARRLARMHYSSKYDDAPMPHSIFFRGGYAIHATGAVRMLGRPASHGCIRLSPAHAALLFSLVKRHGASITIFGSAPGDGRAYAGRRTRARILAEDDGSWSRVSPSGYLRGGSHAPGFVDAPRASSGFMEPIWR